VAKVRAAILAAGRGVRMGGETPKTLLPLDGKGPMLQYIIEGLKKAPVDDLLVITGHRADEVEAKTTELWGSENVTFMRNSRFASWGNFHSVRIALDASPGFDLLVVNCDIVVHPDVYSRVIETKGDLVLAVQRRRHLDREDMRVQLDGEKVKAVSKELERFAGHGEYAGVSLLRGPAPRIYQDIASSLEWRAPGSEGRVATVSKPQTHVYYEDIYNRMAPYVDTRWASVAEGEYAEVDTPEDVPDAVGVVERHF
jgi:choline kinase